VRPRLSEVRAELRPMFGLALPVVIAELGWMTMGMVDTLMVGPLGPEAIGAVGLGSALFIAVGIFAMGMLLGLDTLVSQSFGAGRLDECHRWLVHGVFLSILLTIPTTLVLFLVGTGLERWGMNPDVLRLVRPYLGAVAWSTLPLLVYFAFRRYLQGLAVVRPIMVTLIAANLVNVAANWTLIHGRLGMPALGVAGAAWATVLARTLMALSLLIVILRRETNQQPRLIDTPISVEVARLRRLVAIGAPAAGQLTLEVGVFAMASALAGRMLPASLAAHQIALNIAGFTYMVPLGVASAGAVRVGQAIGGLDAAAAARAGWTALLFGVVFMGVAALAFVTIPRPLIATFTTDARVLEIGVALLAVAAVFQLFDGLQAVATGVLRGLGETRMPMLWNLAGHWFIGLPLAYVLAFNLDFGVIGLWWGLSSGLIICGVALLVVWWRRIHAVPHLLSSDERRIHA
jgi:multidrug resistance protein, MATE family